MPGKDNENITDNSRPEADKASKQTADTDPADDLGDIDPKYREQVKKAYEKNVGSNQEPDEIRSNSDSGSNAE